MRFTWVELVIILAIVLLIFGAGKLPSIAKDLGQEHSRIQDRLRRAIRPREKEAETTKPT